MSVPFSLAPLQQLARRALGEAPVKLEPMAGGASLRRFFRVHAGAKSAVGMFFPDALASEEASSVVVSRWPFLDVQALLHERGVAVPALLGEDCNAGWLLVEDLGDETLAAALERSPERKTELYRRVVSDLARGHSALYTLPEDCVVRTRSFDLELLVWELEHFREWGVEGRGLRLSEGQGARFSDLARRVAQRVRSFEYGFTHRDFQSRNLMLVPSEGGRERLVWIDFQDALLGPRVYDLVALLNDSYQSFDLAFISARLREYCELRGLTSELPAIEREFHWVTVQRKLKDAGRFVFIQHKKGDASYLRFVEPTVALVRRSLAQLPDESDARELASWLDETLSP